MKTTCKQRSQEWVHIYAAGGAAFATIPIPFATSAGLTAAETHMIYWIGRIYGEKLSATEIGLVASGIGLASLGLKVVAMEAANFVPVIGWLVKGGIAASTIEALGALIIKHFEDKYPGKIYAKQEDIESPPPA